MNITYKLQGVKSIKKLSVRFFHNKLDLSTVTNVMLMESEWDAVNQSVKGNLKVTIALQDLKSAILKQYNGDFCNGVLIDKSWLQKVVKTSFMRPKEEDKLVSPDYAVYVSDFSTWWLDNKSSEWSVSAKKKMGVHLQNQYKKFVKTFIEYENVIGEKLQLRNIRVKDLESFAEYLETENYQVLTIERQIGRLRFFLNRAVEHNIEVDKSYKQRIYLDKEEDIEGVYLNEKEIQKIVDQDFSDNYELNITKQNFLIGLFTGMRVSDFIKLDTSNMSEGVFKVKTKKTGASIVVPIHPIIRKVIDSNFGNLPPKVSASDFNIHIKTICQICEIDYLVYGKLFDKDLKRKKLGYYKKYQLISSHICRRSMVSNLKGKVSDEVLMSIGGWKSEKMVNHYTKTTKTEYANELANYWNTKN